MPTSRRVAFCCVQPAHGPQLLAHQHPRCSRLVLGIDLGQRVASDLVVDPLAPQLVGERARRQPLAGLARLDPCPGEGLVVDQADLGRTGRAGARPARPARPSSPACRPAPCGCAPARSGRRAGSCAPPTPDRRPVRAPPCRVAVPRHDPGRAPLAARSHDRAIRRSGRLSPRAARRHPLERLVGLVRLRGARLRQPRRARPGLDPGVDVTRPRRCRPVLAHAVRSHSRRSARRRGRRQERRPADRRRASPGSSSPARWPGRGCP